MRKDGSRFFAIGRMIALRDEAGRHVGFAKIIRDATPTKKLEEALEASEAQLRSLFAQAPWGIALLDLGARIDQTNAAFCQLHGKDAATLRGMHLTTLVHEEDRAAVQRLIDSCFQERRDSGTLEKRIVRPDGTVLWVQNSITLLRDAESRPTGVLDLCHDITPLKRSEEELAQRVRERTSALEDKTAQLESFCYTVAHDLRAPLRAIQGYAELLKSDYTEFPAEEARSYLGRIESASVKLDQLIRDLLAYTRVQQVSLAREEVDLSRLLERVLLHLGETIEAGRQIEVLEPLGRVRSDPVALEHVFTNLVGNAVKFTRPGVPAAIRIHSEERNGYTRLWIEDQGVGIDPRYSERIFQMFERLHPHLNVPGTGVGLAIVAKAMERLGGSCGVEPNQPHGSRFWIELPH